MIRDGNLTNLGSFLIAIVAIVLWLQEIMMRNGNRTNLRGKFSNCYYCFVATRDYDKGW